MPITHKAIFFEKDHKFQGQINHPRSMVIRVIIFGKTPAPALFMREREKKAL
jgi:hypothetical protein